MSSVVCGEGGTGKSLLAAAVARRVVASFPDGVHWVTVGEKAASEDVRRLQADLLAPHPVRRRSAARRQSRQGTARRRARRRRGAAGGGRRVARLARRVPSPRSGRAHAPASCSPRGSSRRCPPAPTRSNWPALPAEQAAAFLARQPLGVPQDPQGLAAVLEAAGGLRLALAVLAATAHVEGGWPGGAQPVAGAVRPVRQGRRGVVGAEGPSSSRSTPWRRRTGAGR